MKAPVQFTFAASEMPLLLKCSTKAFSSSQKIEEVVKVADLSHCHKGCLEVSIAAHCSGSIVGKSNHTGRGSATLTTSSIFGTTKTL